MSVDNKEEFNVLVGKILRMVVNACPAQVRLNTEVFDMKAGSHDGQYYEASPQEQFLDDTLRWLVSEGYIRGEANNDCYIATFHALKVYGAIPSALSN